MSSQTSSAAPTGVGIIGLSASGGWAAQAHLPALGAVPGYEVRALSASSPTSAKAAGDKYGIPLAFGSAEELPSAAPRNSYGPTRSTWWSWPSRSRITAN